MKILMIASYPDSIVPFRGELLRALVSAGCDVHVAAPGTCGFSKAKIDLAALGATLHQYSLDRTGTGVFADIRSVFALCKLLTELRPEAVLSYTLKPVLYGTVVACAYRIRNRYALITGLGYAFTSGRGRLISSFVRLLYRVALSCASMVFFQNPDDEAEFRSSGLLPFRIPSVVLKGSGVNIQTYQEAPLPERGVVFLMAGRLLGDKGVRDYAEAARLLKAKHPGARFLLAGWIDSNPDAIAKEELDSWVRQGVVEYLGRVGDLREALIQASVIVLPSYREGTPRTVLEGMAMGRAVVTTDVPGCRETVDDGENGFLVPAKSPKALAYAMEKFIHNPGLAARMGASSRRKAEDDYDVRRVNATMLSAMNVMSDGAREPL